MARTFFMFAAMTACVGFMVAHADDKPAQAIKGYGTVVDPDGDCQLKEDDGVLTCVIPKTHHDLTYTEKYSKLNSPRVVQDFKGDFDLEVKVKMFDLPREKPSSGGDHSFVSSGLLVYQDDRNFLRMDRAAVGDSPFVWVERFEDGKTVARKLHPLTDADTYLRISRRDNNFTFETSTDGKDWTTVQTDIAHLHEPLKVGVLAINSTAEEFKATLQDFKLVQIEK